MGELLKTASGLEYEDVSVGTGTQAKAGMQIKAHYHGTLTDGSVFDSSYQRKEPFGFRLGAGQVIKGWDEGIVGMKVGGKRRLVIPPELAYGVRGYPPVIPANSTLNFEIELLEAK